MKDGKDMNPEIKKFIDGVGATAEACAVFYKSCITQHFTPEQAFELTKDFLTAMVMRPADKEKDD